MLLKVVAGILLGIWLLLILLGKGGLVHILLLNAIAVAFVEAVRVYRSEMKTE